MKRLLYYFVFSIALLISSACHAAAGIIAYIDYNKDLIVVETIHGYICAESYTPLIIPEIGHKVFGTFQTYGFQPWHIDTGIDTEIKVYIDEFNCSKDEVFNWLRTK